MTIKLITAAALFTLLSCNAGEKETESSKTESTQTVTTDDDAPAAGTDKEAQKAALNEQSKACIRLMNQYEEQQKAAYAAGDAEKAKAFGISIDSAAKANVMIGQQLMALDK